MRTCKFYSPAQGSINRYPHLEMAEDYAFDRPMNIANCSCPAIVGQAPFAQCGYEADYSACIYYDKEDWRTVKSVEVTRTDAEIALMKAERISVQAVRTSIGVPSYRIMLQRLSHEDGEWGEGDVLHIINGGSHGGDAKRVAQELFEQELNTLRSEYPKQDVELPKPEVTSYIGTVVAK